MPYLEDQKLHWRRGALGRLTRGQRGLDDLDSISAHLHTLLNTRLGESLAEPDYGLIEFVDIVHKFPAATHVLRQSIQSAIQRHEPRLQGVRVDPLDDDGGLAPAFEITGTVVRNGVRHGLVKFRITLTSIGHLSVERNW